jgi:nucleoside-diphosphate-sugar epimerase
MHSISDVVKILEKLSGIKIEIGDGPATGHMQFVSDNTLIKKLIEWEPKYNLEEGLTETYEKMMAMYGK